MCRLAVAGCGYWFALLQPLRRKRFSHQPLRRVLDWDMGSDCVSC